MSKEEEIILLEQMICETRASMLEDRKDRLQLEAELNELERELTDLLIPVRKIKVYDHYENRGEGAIRQNKRA